MLKDISTIVQNARKQTATFTIKTNVAPTIKDVLSAKIILHHFTNMQDFTEKFPNTELWLQQLQKNPHWEKTLQQLLTRL